MEPLNASFVGVDWGTTHRRAYVLNAQGQCAQEVSDDDGALASKGRFAQSLDQLLATLQTKPSAAVLSGMVGSALGWHQVPYVDSAVALQDLPEHLFRVPDALSQTPVYIVPGYCVRDAQGQPDVMRGEETQLLGAVALGHTDGWFVLPGTHSKWVQLAAGRIVQLRTYMTGELFDLLRKQGTIAAATGGSEHWDPAAFADGVRAAAHGGLGHALFGVRARVVCGDMAAASGFAYLSGLLIGHELHDVVQAAGAAGVERFSLIGSPALAKLYEASAAQLGLHCKILDAQQAFLAAMLHFQQQGALGA